MGFCTKITNCTNTTDIYWQQSKEDGIKRKLSAFKVRSFKVFCQKSLLVFLVLLAEENQEQTTEKEATEDSYLHPSLLTTSISSVGSPISQLHCNVSVVSVFRCDISFFYIITSVFVHDLRMWVIINKLIASTSKILFPLVVIAY